MAGDEASEEKPIYAKMSQTSGCGTPFFMITVDEGWRQSIMCGDMYEWAADWLVEQLQGKPFAPGKH